MTLFCFKLLLLVILSIRSELRISVHSTVSYNLVLLCNVQVKLLSLLKSLVPWLDLDNDILHPTNPPFFLSFFFLPPLIRLESGMLPF